MARSPSRSSDGGDDAANGRVEPRLLKAIINKNHEEAMAIIEQAKSKSQPIDHLLRLGLMRAAERGNTYIAEYLLKSGAKPDGAPGGRVSPLLKAVEENHAGVVQLLLRFGGNVDAHDKQGRTALMTACWKNSFHIVNELLRCGADVNKKDNQGRNVLHNLAADKHCNWGRDVIDVLLRTNIAIDGPEGQDEKRKTPLHWAAMTGKKELCEMLLMRPRPPRANVNAVEDRDKTPLHLAVAHGRDDIVELLLFHGADVKARSDGGWTALHNACEQGPVKDENERETIEKARIRVKIVRMLLNAGADINARLLNGWTPLHAAAQKGHVEVVECLLERKDIKRAARDTFGVTPFVRAAQKKRRDIVNLLAPSNNVESLSEDALGACKGFNATIVDFKNDTENRVQKRSVYELLYGRDTVNPRKPAVTVLPKDSKNTNFRWIHLPANSMAWAEALLTKVFIEEGANDVEGFRALERSFTHQHRGARIHSHFMRPLCQSTPRAPKNEDEIEQEAPQITINGLGIATTAGAQESPLPHFQKPPVRTGTVSTDQTDWTARSSGTGTGAGKEGKGKTKEKTKKLPKWSGSKQAGSRSGGTNTPTRQNDHHGRQKLSMSMTESGFLRSPGSPGKRDSSFGKSNIYTYMPYLHFETDQRRQAMQAAIARIPLIKEREKHGNCIIKQVVPAASTYDEMLLRAHLTSSQVSLHVRRTLDQFFYHNIDTQSRDCDQVVYRYQRGSSDPQHADPKIFMVDQLWMWTLGKDLIITAFPQRWEQPRNDPLNVLDGVIEDINSKTREPVKSVHDLAMVICSRCSGIFDRHRVGDGEYQFLDMFESSIGDATERETELFKEFNTASGEASKWLHSHRRPNRFSRHLEAAGRQQEHQNKRQTPHHTPTYAFTDSLIKEDNFGYEDNDNAPAHAPLFVDKLLDIGAETDLLAETKDIRDELNMITKVLEDQRNVLPELELSIIDAYSKDHKFQAALKRRFRDMLKTIDTHIKDLERMDKQAERIYKSITDLLDLKQKHANAFEARFARDQAAGTARQSQVIMVFTVVTIVFLPLSFIAAFFSINVREFPQGDGGEPSLPLSYVGKYMFGIGLAISIPFIAIAFSFDAIGDFFREAKRRLRYRRKSAKNIHHDCDDDTHSKIYGPAGAGEKNIEYTVDMRALDHALSVTRLSARASTLPRRARHSIESRFGGVFAAGSSIAHVHSRSSAGAGKGDGDGSGDGGGMGNGIGIGIGIGNGSLAGRLSVEGTQVPIERLSTGFRLRASGDVERGV